MKKRVLAVVLGLCMAMSLGACSGELKDDVIVVKKYKGLEVEKVEVTAVTDADVENSINSTIKNAGKTISVTDRAVQNGDEIVLDYAGKKDGVAFDGGTATDQTLVIGSGQFIDGFEEAIIGHHVGETFDINVTFPENYGNEELNGQPVVFTITVDKIVGYPELTVELLKELKAEETTVEAYRERVRKDLEASNQQAAKTKLEQAVWAELVKNCTIEEYPQDKYTEYTTQVNNQYNYLAQMYGVTVDQMLQGYYGISLDQMVKEMIKQELAAALIAEEEEITVSDKYYEKRLAEIATQYGYESPEEVEKVIGRETLEKSMTQEKVGEFLVENCKQVDKTQVNKTEDK